LKNNYFLFLITIIAIYFVACENNFQKSENKFKSLQDNTNCREWVFLLSERIDTLVLLKTKITSKENLKKLLSQYNFGDSAFSVLQKKTKQYIDLSKLKTEDQCLIAHNGDDLNSLKLLILKKSPTEYLICKNNKDSIYCFLYKKSISIKERSIALELNKSISLILKEKKIDPSLGDLIKSAYQDRLDISKNKKGDKIKIIYSEKMVETESLGIDKIKGIIYTRNDKDYLAIPYTAPDDTSDFAFYDENGNNLAKFFLNSPLKNGRMASSYNLNRFHPVLKVFKAHLGTDFAAPTGTPIMTTAKGIIIEAGYKINNGNYVKVKHNNIYSTQYLHMSKIGKNIKPGTIVKQGQIIGYVGSTGLATGPHVCYRFWKNGKQTNPFKEKQNIPNRLEDRYLNDYLQIFSEIKFKLDKISFENQINP
jgi:murein DD-endopeptidase MepM/ murein hydrolase activator NlpD